MKLTDPQHNELKRLAKQEQSTFGAARARVQRTLAAHGLAEFVEADGSKSKTPEIADFCRITEDGRALAIPCSGCDAPAGTYCWKWDPVRCKNVPYNPRHLHTVRIDATVAR